MLFELCLSLEIEKQCQGLRDVKKASRKNVSASRERVLASRERVPYQSLYARQIRMCLVCESLQKKKKVLDHALNVDN